MEYSSAPNRIETQSNESDDTDDEIIVKTIWPVYRATSIDIEKQDSDYKDQEDNDFRSSSENTADNDIKYNGTDCGEKGNVEVTCESGGNCDTEDEVFEKVQRGRMEFPCSSECKSTPTKSCLNGLSTGLTEHSHHKPKESTTSHQDLSEDNKSIKSASTKKRKFCHLN
ncbi:hypothetical protein OS493_020695 [Desmophyllum pertusum]|uniref:Uncharacterized protein n=1 Tax=Desmophyllum pertusum TaxID=174260 RepID=A0A9X0CJJ1_9CNID|nr:hypothetical protein OS493_020695 [Desmophyllum pertusum]